MSFQLNCLQGFPNISGIVEIWLFLLKGYFVTDAN